VHVLDPDPECAAGRLADRHVVAALNDVDAAVELARAAAVVALTAETMPPDALAAAAVYARCHPHPEAVRALSDSAQQRAWLRREGYPVAAFRASADAELSVLVARREDSTCVVYPPALNRYENGALDWSVWPAILPASVVQRAMQLAAEIAHSLALGGLLVVEFLVDREGALHVQSLAPRPDATYHHSERGAATCQFEQFVRALCGLPLGSVTVVKPSAVAILAHSLWRNGTAPPFALAISVPDVRLHLYGVDHSREEGVVGHLSSTGDSVDEARHKVLNARSRLGSS
jgi:phosphoribosylaminoimidazole carboxylase (NCAIR synthetase)